VTANPRGHHAVSVVTHALNVVLLFFVLRSATGRALASPVVASLYAVHPLNAASAYAAALQFSPGMSEAQQYLDALRGKP
jgi:hypothetical protein